MKTQFRKKPHIEYLRYFWIPFISLGAAVACWIGYRLSTGRVVSTAEYPDAKNIFLQVVEYSDEPFYQALIDGNQGRFYYVCEIKDERGVMTSFTYIPSSSVVGRLKNIVARWNSNTDAGISIDGQNLICQFISNESANWYYGPDAEDQKRISELSLKIKESRKRKSTDETNRLVAELMKIWSPTGKPLTDLKELLGKPNEQASDSIVYRFDDGYGGSEWIFTLTNNRITGVNHNGID